MLLQCRAEAARAEERAAWGAELPQMRPCGAPAAVWGCRGDRPRPIYSTIPSPYGHSCTSKPPSSPGDPYQPEEAERQLEHDSNVTCFQEWQSKWVWNKARTKKQKYSNEGSAVWLSTTLEQESHQKYKPHQQNELNRGESVLLGPDHTASNIYFNTKVFCWVCTSCLHLTDWPVQIQVEWMNLNRDL